MEKPQAALISTALDEQMWGQFETAKKFPPIIEFWWV